MSFNHRNIIYAKLSDNFQLPANVSTCDTEAARAGEVRAMRYAEVSFWGTAPKSSAQVHVLAGRVRLRSEPG